MNDTVISILIPVYNCELYVEECVRSVLSQDYKNLQIVIYDDGSTDNSLNICKNFAASHPNIKLISEKNQGVAHARNRLLEEIKGDYFLFVDADDWIDSSTVGFLYNMISTYNGDIATCSSKREDNSNDASIKVEVLGRAQFIPEFIKHKKLNGSLWNKLIKTQIISDAKFREGIYYGEDALFVWEILQRVSRIVRTDKQLYHYRANPESLSGQKWTADKKGTGFVVWREICLDVELKYPRFKQLANARCALEDMWALYFASRSNWPKDVKIEERQTFIKKHFKDLIKYPLDGISSVCTAYILSHWYGGGQFLEYLKNLFR